MQFRARNRSLSGDSARIDDVVLLFTQDLIYIDTHMYMDTYIHVHGYIHTYTNIRMHI